MDTEILVDQRVDGGRALLTQLGRDGIAVSVAFWVCTREELLWFFYIASDSFNRESIGQAYGAVNVSLNKISENRVTLSELRLVHPTSDIAVAAMALRKRPPGRPAIKLQRTRLGDVDIEEGFIYPPVGQMTSLEVVQTVAALMNRRGRIEPSTVALSNGKSMRAFPVGMHLTHAGETLVKLHDVLSETDREVAVGDIASID